MEPSRPSHISVAALRQRFERQERLELHAAIRLIRAGAAALSEEATLLEVDAPVCAIGDIHGQFYDLLALLDRLGTPSPANKLVFLGDYVDRGAFSCEVLLLLLALKLEYPRYVFLLRGNHEDEAIASHYGFRAECETKYGLSLFYHFCSCFAALPIGAVVTSTIASRRSDGEHIQHAQHSHLVQHRVLCVHGGLSPHAPTLAALAAMPRQRRSVLLPAGAAEAEREQMRVALRRRTAGEDGAIGATGDDSDACALAEIQRLLLGDESPLPPGFVAPPSPSPLSLDGGSGAKASGQSLGGDGGGRAPVAGSLRNHQLKHQLQAVAGEEEDVVGNVVEDEQQQQGAAPAGSEQAVEKFELTSALVDTLWSDPLPLELRDATTAIMEAAAESCGAFARHWMPNRARGCSHFFGAAAATVFLEENGLACVVRAHELQQEGFQLHFDSETAAARDAAGFDGLVALQWQHLDGAPERLTLPPVLTVFSAPNYCGRFGNKGAFVRIGEAGADTGCGDGSGAALLKIEQFSATMHPPALTFPSRAIELNTQLLAALPYMPSVGWLPFFKSVLALRHELDAARENSRQRSDSVQRVRTEAGKKPRADSWPSSELSCRGSGDNGVSCSLNAGTAAAVDGIGLEIGDCPRSALGHGEAGGKAAPALAAAATPPSASTPAPIPRTPRTVHAEMRQEGRTWLEDRERGGAVTGSHSVHKSLNLLAADDAPKSLQRPNKTPLSSPIAMQSLGSSPKCLRKRQTSIGEAGASFSKKEFDACFLLFDLMDSSGAMQIGPFEMADFFSHVLHEKVDLEGGDALLLIEALDYDGDGRVSFTDLLDTMAFVKKHQKQLKRVTRHTRPSLKLALRSDTSTRISLRTSPTKRPKHMWPSVLRWLVAWARPMCIAAIGTIALRLLWRALSASFARRFLRR